VVLVTAPELERWPQAKIDGVARVHVLASALPHVHLVERVIDVPYERVWHFLEDIEVSVPAFDTDVQRIVITRRDGNLLRMTVRTRYSPPVPFICEMGDSHLVMRAPGNLYVVAFGARALGDGRTLYAQFEGSPRSIGRLATRRIARHVARDAERLKTLLERSA
jgi:hypothetical protein